MNTFLPYPDFAKSAACLDRQRLGKQRVEVLQILKALRFGGGWSHHAATRMWRGYEPALCCYGYRICEEWLSRGYIDTCKDKIFQLDPLTLVGTWKYEHSKLVPKWLDNADFHASHRSNLLRKFPEWYGQFGWTEPPNLPYVWPV